MKSSDTLQPLNFDALDVILENKSAIDSKTFLTEFNDKSDVFDFLKGYGINLDDPIESSELYGQFQEAMLFIRKNFLKEGNDEGLDLTIPKEIVSITSVAEIFKLSSTNKGELGIWAGIILKVIHTLIHIDKDLRQNYFNLIQTQIFDRYYKYLDREGDSLFLKSKEEKIPLAEFQTKSKKTRESVVIKLLHKKENVAEELFDRIGIRLITKNKYDCIRVIEFMHKNHIIVPHNIKPSRSHNSLIDIKTFKKGYNELLGSGGEMTLDILNKITEGSLKDDESQISNEHSLEEYKAIHFTCRQLINYTNPFYGKFDVLKDEFKDQKEVVKKLENLDTSSISKDSKFFYPYEIQITDEASHLVNTEGESSHNEYKKSQLSSAMNRLFAPLINI